MSYSITIYCDRPGISSISCDIYSEPVLIPLGVVYYNNTQTFITEYPVMLTATVASGYTFTGWTYHYDSPSSPVNPDGPVTSTQIGIRAGRDVYIAAEASYNGGGPTVTIPEWTWSFSNGRASDAQTYEAYTSITGTGLDRAVSRFSYLVWNDMCDKAKLMREYGSSTGQWATYYNGVTYLSYNDTLMSSSNKTLTAARFNALKYQIGSLYSTGISDRSSGDVVYGYYFITLTDCMNAWISSYNSSV